MQESYTDPRSPPQLQISAADLSTLGWAISSLALQSALSMPTSFLAAKNPNNGGSSNHAVYHHAKQGALGKSSIAEDQAGAGARKSIPRPDLMHTLEMLQIRLI